mmetsp:Transcript_98085/g.184441  ORF Transcript_98085/g.184441 Transcript_98085/m.184441 type:complete len:370 (-) Transcript_98085:81-1190(-)
MAAAGASSSTAAGVEAPSSALGGGDAGSAVDMETADTERQKRPGLRCRLAPQEPLPCETPEEAEAVAARLPKPREVCIFAVLLVCSVFTTGYFLRAASPAVAADVEMWRWNCRQCKQEWWRDFWRWRLEADSSGHNPGDLKPQPPPPGMDWEWGDARNDTDWWGASREIVDKVVRVHVDPSAGPVLQVGCGDSPLAALLHEAGYRKSENLDVAPQVIEAVQRRYPASEYPGMQFELRDFMGRGPPQPLHRFSAVIDKAGIWDWLQEEKPTAIQRLLSTVRDALIQTPKPGVYIVATKQTPSEFQETLSAAQQMRSPLPSSANEAMTDAWADNAAFAVETTRPLGAEETGALRTFDGGPVKAWVYVLIPL